MEADASTRDSEIQVRGIAERHGLGAREIDALTVFFARVRGSDPNGG
jgi:hypothetical protein